MANRSWFVRFGLIVVAVGSTVAVHAAMKGTQRSADRQPGIGVLVTSAPLMSAPNATGGWDRLQYVDAHAHVQIQGLVETATQRSDERSSRLREFAGDYAPRSTTEGPGGRFYLAVYDNGAPGPSKDDCCEIRFSGGVYDGYASAGTWSVHSLPPVD